jgi:hypothetical protein
MTLGAGTRATVTVTTPIPAAERQAIKRMNNNALIIRLQFATNHLSRWLSPIHDPEKLERAVYHGEPTVKDLVIGMRDEERRIFPLMFAISVKNRADLDKIPAPVESAQQEAEDRQRTTIALMSQFRQLRQSTCSLLRGMPDDAWDLVGVSRRGQNASIRQFAEHLAVHDIQYLRVMDETLDRTGAREGLAKIQKVHLDELLKLVPEKVEV